MPSRNYGVCEIHDSIDDSNGSQIKVCNVIIKNLTFGEARLLASVLGSGLAGSKMTVVKI